MAGDAALLLLGKPKKMGKPAGDDMGEPADTAPDETEDYSAGLEASASALKAAFDKGDMKAAAKALKDAFEMLSDEE